MKKQFTRITFLFLSVLASATLFAQSISSNLNGRTGVKVNISEAITVNLTGTVPAGTSPKIAIQLQDPAQAPHMNLTLSHPLIGSLSFAFNSSGVAEYTLPMYMATTLSGTALFTQAGTYNYTFYIINANTNDTLFTGPESVVVADLTLPTVSSDLNGQSIPEGQQANFEVTLGEEEYKDTLVNVFFKINPAQASDVSFEYYNTGNATWETLAFNGNGEYLLGSMFGFALTDSVLEFRTVASAVGQYDYSLGIIHAGNGDTLAVSEESFTVVDAGLPIITSSLSGTVFEGTALAYNVTVTANNYTDSVANIFLAFNPTQAGDINVEYNNGGTWENVVLSVNGTATFGGSAGFGIADSVFQFRVTFDAPGSYAYRFSLFENDVPNDTLAFTAGSIVVTTLVAASIESDLNGRANVKEGIEENFEVNIVKNDASANVRIRITLDNASQKDAITLSHQAPGGTSFAAVSFDAAGVALLGTSAGSVLADEDHLFKVTFGATGTYGYNIAIINVADNAVVAENDESVEVLENVSISEKEPISVKLFPNPTTDMLTIQTDEVGGSVVVYTLTGQQIINQNIAGKTMHVSLGTFPAGIYVAKVKQGIAEHTFRVIKK